MIDSHVYKMWFHLLVTICCNEEIAAFLHQQCLEYLNKLVKTYRKSLLDPEGDQSVHKHGGQIYISDNGPPEVLPK